MSSFGLWQTDRRPGEVWVYQCEVLRDRLLPRDVPTGVELLQGAVARNAH